MKEVIHWNRAAVLPDKTGAYLVKRFGTQAFIGYYFEQPTAFELHRWNQPIDMWAELPRGITDEDG